MESRLFGDVKLNHNLDSSGQSTFVDRWVQLEIPGRNLPNLIAPVRHGEGRLVIQSLAENTQICLRYRDDVFNNGSVDNIAGLSRRIGKSHFVGTMPHPEIFTSADQHPDHNFSENAKLAVANILKELKEFA